MDFLCHCLGDRLRHCLGDQAHPPILLRFRGAPPRLRFHGLIRQRRHRAVNVATLPSPCTVACVVPSEGSRPVCSHHSVVSQTCLILTSIKPVLCSSGGACRATFADIRTRAVSSLLSPFSSFPLNLLSTTAPYQNCALSQLGRGQEPTSTMFKAPPHAGGTT